MRKSKLTLRMTAWFMALALLVGILPCFSIYACALDEPTKISINFVNTVIDANNVVISTPGYTMVTDEINTCKFSCYPKSMGGVLAHAIALNGKSWPAVTALNQIAFTINVDVPVAGVYKLFARCGLYYDACDVSIYVDDAYYTGDYDMRLASGYASGTEKQLNSLYLTAGTHKISYRQRAANVSTIYMYLNTLTLDPSSVTTLELDRVAVNNVPDTLDIGESFELSAQAFMNDDSVHHFGLTASGSEDTSNKMTVTSSNPNIISVTNFNNVKIAGGDTASATLTAVSAGSTKITSTATVNGKTVKNSTVVTVGHNPAPAQGALRITVSNSTGAALNDVAISRDESTPAFTLNEQGNYNTGTSFTLTAPAVDGKTFLYWKNATSKRVVTTSETCTFKIGSNTYLTAVYKEIGSGVLVEFVDRNCKVLQSTFLNDTTTSVNAPTPYSIGYDFQSWISGNLNITGGSAITSALVGGKDTIFSANYSKSATQYSITVTGSTADGTTTHTYDDKISVTANPPSGQDFTYWTRNGQISSYSPTYSFYVWDNATVDAVYVPTGEALPAIPQVMMDTVKTGTGKVIFSSERSVPDGYELIESGILILNSSYYTTDSAINLQALNAVKSITQSEQKNGQFTVRRDNISGTWYARAYLIYKNTSTNEFKVIYSNVVNGIAQ